MTRSRIKRHVRMRAGDLVPHEDNCRTHPEAQRRALLDLYAEVGFARSLLAYELPDGRLKLIDGHLRQQIDPDMVVDMEVLDVDDAEARKLLLSIDPMSALAGYDDAVLSRLRDTVSTESDALANLWATVADGQRAAERAMGEARCKDREKEEPPDRWLVIIECADERSQAEALRVCQQHGLECKAAMS